MASSPSPAEKPRVLIVDDEQDMLEFMERVLRREFAVTITSDAEDALRRLESDRYDMLISDHQMPKISGLQLLQKSEALAPELVRIVISGFAEAPEIQSAVADGVVHGYIIKPIDSRKLLDVIEQTYHQRVSG